MKRLLIVSTASIWLFAGLALPVARAGTIFAVWDSPSGDTVTGTIGSTQVSLSNMAYTAGVMVYSPDVFNCDPGGVPCDLSTSDFSAAPGAPDSQAVAYMPGAPWTFAVTSGAPIPYLNLYTMYWRGWYGIGSLTDIITYTFSSPFTILSGDDGATVSGNSLTLAGSPTGSLYNGIVQFTDVTSLSVTATNGEAGGWQILTFASGDAPSAVDSAPEPASLVLLALGGGMLALLGRKRGDRLTAEPDRLAACAAMMGLLARVQNASMAPAKL